MCQFVNNSCEREQKYVSGKFQIFWRGVSLRGYAGGEAAPGALRARTAQPGGGGDTRARGNAGVLLRMQWRITKNYLQTVEYKSEKY